MILKGGQSRTPEDLAGDAMSLVVLCVVAVVLLASIATAADMRPLLDAIRAVETGGHADPENAVGDGGASLGPYQISRAYWSDSRVPGRYEMVRDRAYAERVMIAYWKRYCPRGDAQTMARVHNGGPRGPRKAATLNYWRKVQRELSRKP